MVTTRTPRAPLTRYLLLVLVLMLVPFPATPGMASPPARSVCETFSASVPGIYHQVCGSFAVYWRANGGLAQQGYPLTGEVSEINQQDGKAYTVQYFERAVFEYHPEITTENKVLLSLLGAAFYRIKYPQEAPGQTANRGTTGSNPRSMYFEKTGKWLGGAFLKYWLENGGLAQQGMPKSDEFSEKSAIDGKSYKVQYFERAVFEYHPGDEQRDDDDIVLLSLLGVFRLRSALVQPYDEGDYKGWVCHSKGSVDERCSQIGANGPSEDLPNEVAEGGPPLPFATLAQPGDILLANRNGALHARYAGRDLKLMNSSKVGLWRSPPCTDSDSITLLAEVVLVDDKNIPLQLNISNICVDPRDTVYGARRLPDGSVDVAVSSGAQGAVVIDATGRPSTVIGPGQQVHASPAGVVGTPGPIDAEFAKNFDRYTGTNLACGSKPVRGIGKVWDENPSVRDKARCPRALEVNIPGTAYQEFEGGYMFWREDTYRIYAFIGNPANPNGTWIEYVDTWREGDPITQTTRIPPAGRYAPVRGFGRIWNANQSLQSSLGWGLEPEYYIGAAWQSFEGANALWTADKIIRFMYPDGTYEQFDDTFVQP